MSRSNENSSNEERTEASRMLEDNKKPRVQVVSGSVANGIVKESAGYRRGNIQRRALRNKSRTNGNIVCKCKRLVGDSGKGRCVKYSWS